MKLKNFLYNDWFELGIGMLLYGLLSLFVSLPHLIGMFLIGGGLLLLIVNLVLTFLN